MVGDAGGLNRLIRDRALRQSLGQAARCRSAAYGVPAMTAAMAAIYADVAATTAPTSAVA